MESHWLRQATPSPARRLRDCPEGRMQTSELDLLFRTSRGNLRQIAIRHIFRQESLSDDDHAFLERHIDKLDDLTLLEWLGHGAPKPELVLNAVFRQTTEAKLASEWHVWNWSTALPRLYKQVTPEVFDGIVERLHGKAEPDHFWAWVRHLRGSSETFQKLLASPHQPRQLISELFPVRRDELALRRALQRMIREGVCPEAKRLASDFGTWSGIDDDKDSNGDDSGGRTSPLLASATLTALLERTGLLDLFDPADILPESVRFGVERDAGDLGAPDHFFLCLALRWPHLKAETWYVAQCLRAVERGVSYGFVALEMSGVNNRYRAPHTKDEAKLRRVIERIADESLRLGQPAPWVGAIVLAGMVNGTREEWERAFNYLDRILPNESQRMSADEALELRRLEKLLPWIAERRPLQQALDILSNAHLPQDAEDEFDERLLSYDKHLRRIFRGPHGVLFRRIASLPLTPTRARRLLRLAVQTTDLFSNLTAGEWEKIAAMCEPVSPDDLPPVGEFLRMPREPVENREDSARSTLEVTSREQSERTAERGQERRRAAANLYRCLTGTAGNSRLHAWVREPLVSDERHSLSLSILGVVYNLQVVPDALNDELRNMLDAAVAKLDLYGLTEVHDVAPELATAEMVLSSARALVRNTDCSWYNLLDRKRPAWLQRSLMMERALVVTEEMELEHIIEWLRDDGCAPADLITACLRALERTNTKAPFKSPFERLLGETLSSRTLWEKHGPRTIRAILALGTPVTLLWVVQASVNYKRDSAEIDPSRYRSIMGAAHEAFAVVMLEHVREAVRVFDANTASRALRTLCALQPPARLSGRLYSMRKKAGISEDIASLVALCINLMRHSSTREANGADLEAALAIWFEEPDELPSPEMQQVA
ncbi:MAG: hypothetical protein IPK82_20175 [Polyangiaceae bacterium]|nr:hypothetical protein [Polyangiaceae bacterium]